MASVRAQELQSALDNYMRLYESLEMKLDLEIAKPAPDLYLIQDIEQDLDSVKSLMEDCYQELKVM
jgi:hypothetical protein